MNIFRVLLMICVVSTLGAHVSAQTSDLEEFKRLATDNNLLIGSSEKHATAIAVLTTKVDERTVRADIIVYTRVGANSLEMQPVNAQGTQRQESGELTKIKWRSASTQPAGNEFSSHSVFLPVSNTTNALVITMFNGDEKAESSKIVVPVGDTARLTQVRVRPPSATTGAETTHLP